MKPKSWCLLTLILVSIVLVGGHTTGILGSSSRATGEVAVLSDNSSVPSAEAGDLGASILDNGALAPAGTSGPSDLRCPTTICYTDAECNACCESGVGWCRNPGHIGCVCG